MQDMLFEMPEQRQPAETYRCNVRRCSREITATADGARAAGWIVWQGTTYGGRADVAEFCPACATRGARERKARSRDVHTPTLAGLF